MRDSAFTDAQSQTVVYPATLSYDCGESSGGKASGDDASIMRYLDMANIAGGRDDADWDTMAATVKLAKSHGVKVGAHPSVTVSSGAAVDSDTFRNCLIAHVGALSAFCRESGVPLHHLKLYDTAYIASARDAKLAQEAAKVAKLFGISFVGLSGSQHEKACKEAGVTFVPEWFADVEYNDDGSLLVAKSGEQRQPVDEAKLDEKVQRLMREGRWSSVTGRQLSLPKTTTMVTICVRGDQPGAREIVAAVREAINTC